VDVKQIYYGRCFTERSFSEPKSNRLAIILGRSCAIAPKTNPKCESYIVDFGLLVYQPGSMKRTFYRDRTGATKSRRPAADIVIVCLSEFSLTKKGFVQKEIRFALDVADDQPPGRIFVIPVRLVDCDVPERLKKWQWVNLFENGGFERLIRALRHCSGGKESQ
jgi:hypothetical protein